MARRRLQAAGPTPLLPAAWRRRGPGPGALLLGAAEPYRGSREGSWRPPPSMDGHGRRALNRASPSGEKRLGSAKSVGNYRSCMDHLVPGIHRQIGQLRFPGAVPLPVKRFGSRDQGIRRRIFRQSCAALMRDPQTRIGYMHPARMLKTAGVPAEVHPGTDAPRRRLGQVVCIQRHSFCGRILDLGENHRCILLGEDLQHHAKSGITSGPPTSVLLSSATASLIRHSRGSAGLARSASALCCSRASGCLRWTPVLLWP